MSTMSNDETVRVQIGGMSCGGCVRGVARALDKAGIKARDIQVGTALVDADASHDAIRAALEGAGFQVLAVELH